MSLQCLVPANKRLPVSGWPILKKNPWQQDWECKKRIVIWLIFMYCFKLFHLKYISIWWSKFSVYFHVTHSPLLTHWGRVTHICVNKLPTISLDNGFSPPRHQVIIWINTGILLEYCLGLNVSKIILYIPICLSLESFYTHTHIYIYIYIYVSAP